MTSTSLDLSGKLDPVREQVFRDVSGAASALGIQFFIVGACARDLLLDLHFGLPAQRATNDVDFGIRIETWDRFAELKRTLTETGRYASDPQQPQRLFSPQGAFIDVVPFGGIEDSATRNIAWPPDRVIVMNALGFEEAFQHAINVRFAADLVINVSSLAGLTLMKLIAWHDRRTMKDAKDIKFIMLRYLQAGNEGRLEPGEHADLLAEGTFVSVELASARLLGRDVAILLNDQSLPIVLKMLEEPSALASRMASGSVEIDEAFESALPMLEAFRQGILDTIKQP